MPDYAKLLISVAAGTVSSFVFGFFLLDPTIPAPLAAAGAGIVISCVVAAVAVGIGD